MACFFSYIYPEIIAYWRGYPMEDPKETAKENPEATQPEPEQKTATERREAVLASRLGRVTSELWKLITLLPRLLWDLLMLIGNLTDTTDAEGTVSSIKEGIKIKGYNIWILMASALIAAIGLDTNSAAVIIGAMLISPLMSPILGIGLSVGIMDRKFLVDSLYNFGIAIVIALVTSTIYFLLTPLGDLTPEMDARTRPTLLDVLIAFFGGVAGIVAGSRKEMTNAIPGVAIATALMPPLCTAGYGLAKLDMNVLFGAGYLFFLNSVFISLATFLIVRFLQFPVLEKLEASVVKISTSLVALFVIIVCVPSAYLLIQLVKEQSFKSEIEHFLEENFDDRENCRVISWNYKPDTLPEHNILEVTLAGDHLDSLVIERIITGMDSTVFKKTRLALIQTNFDPEEISGIEAGLRSEQQKIDGVLSEMAVVRGDLENIRANMQAGEKKSPIMKDLYTELVTLYPDLDRFAITDLTVVDRLGEADTIPSIAIRWDAKLPVRKQNEREKQLVDFMKIRLKADTLRLMYF